MTIDQNINNGLPNIGLNKLILLSVSSIVLCLSFVLTLLVPYPLTLMFLIFGRAKSLAVIAVGIIASYYLGNYFYSGSVAALFYGASAFSAYLIFEFVSRGLNPVRGLIGIGFLFVGILTLLISLYGNSIHWQFRKDIASQVKVVSDQIVKNKKEYFKNGNTDSENSEILEIASNPDLLAGEILKNLPSRLFMGIFFWLWINFILVLRSGRIIFKLKKQSFNENAIFRFKVPEFFIWPFIVILFFTIFGDKVVEGTEWIEVVGRSLMECFGVFYFFQGFGIYVSFLDFVQITGIFRSILIVFTLFTGSWFIAGIGLFDLWINFRKYFVKK
ncbi:MAG: DUF2232 domain-containing protein [Bacteriovoracaceae bacterium]